MKKFYLYSLLTSLLLLCSNVASAHDFEVNGVYYTIASSSAKTVAVTYSGSYANTVADEYSGIVTIPSTVTYNNVTYIVEGIGMSAFRGCTGVILVNISEGVKIIGESAFRDCSALASVTIPNSVTTIGDYAFYECSSLAKLNISGSITSIGYSAFGNCTSLKRINITDLSAWCKIDFGDIGIVRSLTRFDLYLNGEKVTNLVIPSDITEIKKNTFQYCSGFTSIEIHNSVTSIGSGAFKYCSDLTNITIPESVTSIGERAFNGCTGLTSVTIPNRVTSIGESAFYDCSGLTSVTIPNSVTTIGESAFGNCTSLTAVHITDLSAWCKINFVTYASANPLYDGANLYLNGEKVTNLVIPSDITEIKKYAFYGCSGLTDITFHDNVMLINQYAFKRCSGLTNVTIGSGVMVLGANAFEICSNLRCVTIPNSVISIGDNAFYGCSNLYTVIDYSDLGITKGSTDNGYVGYYATNIYTSGDDIPQDYIFETIDGVNTLVAYFGKSNDVVLPSNYNGGNYAIGDSVFYNSSITSIKIPNSVTSIGNYAFRNCSALTSVTIPNSVTSIGNYAFYNCPLEKVEINTTTIDTWFRGHTSIKEIIIGNSVTSIGERAFGGCTNLTSVTIGNSVTSIGGSAFDDCSGLTNVTIPNSVTSIGSSAFRDCSGLTSITIPNSVTSIGSSAFYGCTGLTNVTIPNSVTSIGSSAFYGCTGLTNVTIPNSVKSIGNSAFYNCPLEKVEINTTTIDTWFRGHTSIKEIIIGNSVTSIGSSAFRDCSGLESVTVDSGNTVYDSREGCNAIIETATNTLIQGCKNTIIPNSVTSIGSSAFYGCTGLTNVTIPNSVTSIGNSAFYDCSGITEIYIEATIPPSVSSSAFYNVPVSIPVYVPAGSKTAYQAANTWKSFTNIVEIPGGICGDDATWILRDSTLTISGSSAMYNYTDSVAPWSTYRLEIKEVVVNDSVTSIGDGAFFSCTGLASVTIGNGVHRIGEAAFQGCSALKDIYVNGIVPALLYSESFAEHYASATLHVPAGTKAAYQSSVSQREEMEIKRLPVYNNDLLASMSGFNKYAQYEIVKVETQNPDVAGTLNGNDYLLAYQPSKIRITDLPKATFETSIVHGGRYKIALVTAPWFIESYSDTLIRRTIDPQYADSYLRVRVNQNKEQLAMFPCDSFNIGTSNTKFGVWEKHAIVPDRSRIDTIFLKDANNEDYIFDFVNGHSVGVNIELLRPLEYNEGNGRYTAKHADRFAFRFLLDQIMLIPVDESTIVSTIYWKNFNNIVEEANDLTGDVDGDGVIDVADATTLVSMILDNSLATDAADVDGDGTVDVADATALVSIILGKDTASAAPAKAAATRAGEVSTVSADGDGSTLLININNPGYPFSAIQFDLELPEGIEVDFDGEYYAVDLGSRTNSRKHSYPECAIQPDGSLRVVIISMSNALYNGTEGDVATAALKVNGAADGDYQFTIKNVVLSAPGSKEKLAPYTGWINVTGGVTGISDIKEERAESNDIYDLQGRKVTEPVKGGIYIQNGKKVMW